MHESWPHGGLPTITRPGGRLPSNEGFSPHAQAPPVGVPINGPVTETLATTGARPTEDAVLELQRESESQHLARLGVTGLNAAGFVVAGLLVLLLPSNRSLSLVALASALAAYA